MARMKVASAALVGMLVVAGLGACGSSSSATSPQAVQSAFKTTANQSALQLTLSLQGKLSDFPSNGSSGLTSSQEQAILNSRLVLTVHAASGTTLANAGSGGELALSLQEGGNTLLQVRLVGSNLFAQVDIQQLTSAYGLDKGKAAQLRSELGQLGSRIGGLSALANGQWVSLNISTLGALVAAAGITLPSAPQLVARIVGSFFDSLAQGTNITSVGASKAQMTVNAQQLVTDLAQAVAATPGVSTFGKEISSLAQRAHAAVPANKSGKVIVTVSGGIVSNLNLSLNQFDTSQKLSGPVSADLAVAKSGAVSAPSGATPINIPQLVQALSRSSVNA
jgi:hypothetical protein